MTYAQPMPPPRSKVKRFGFLALAIAAVIGLFAGGMVATFGGATTVTPAAPAPTVTVTQTVEAEPEPTEEPEPEPAAYKAKKSDWKVGVKVRGKQCFGSAGCNVTVKLDPPYVGDRPLPDTGTIEVFYNLSGDESGPIAGSFTVTDSQIHFTEEVSMSTMSSGTKIKAKITDATYSEN